MAPQTNKDAARLIGRKPMRLSSVGRMGLAAITSLLISLFTSEFFVRAHASTSWMGLIMFCCWLLSYILPVYIVGMALYSSFKVAPKRLLLFNILNSYFGIIIIFAGLYYSMCMVGDCNDAVEQYLYYRFEREYAGLRGLQLNETPKAFPYKSHCRVFNGMNDNLWLSVEDNIPLAYNRDESINPTTDYWISVARKPIEQVVRFKPEARCPVFLECLHFSIITMTTVGYGDIIPNVWFAKLFADIQALSGVMLFGVALGMLFGNWWDGQSSAAETGKQSKKTKPLHL